MEMSLPLNHMVDHPQGGFTALWNGPHVLSIGFPDNSGLDFPIAGFVPGQWTLLSTPVGHPIPIIALVDSNGVLVRWLDRTDPTAASPISSDPDEARRQINLDNMAADALQSRYAGSSPITWRWNS